MLRAPLQPRRGHWLRLTLVLVVLATAAAAAYAFYVEPRWLEVTRYTLNASVARHVRIAHLSDLHTHEFGPLERDVVTQLRLANPDIIVITGDTVDQGSLAPARDFVANLSAPLGIWIVRGNWERWTLKEDERAFYASIGAHFLDNEGTAVREDLFIAGLDDPMTGHPDASRALAGAPVAAFKIVLMHAPDHFKDIAGRFDLALAGHTHGGQIRLPGYGPLWLPEGGRSYVRGWFTLNRSHLFVSRGLGTSRVRARFLARPELAIIDLRPRESAQP
jgi:predicted MPP superfamily phosphohydrolase